MSLMPIILGVTLSSLFEIDFKIKGFIITLLATAIFSMINIYSKILLIDKINGITYLLFNSINSTIFLLPFAIYVESADIYYKHTMSDITRFLLMNVLISTLAFLQSISALFILTKVQPLTFSILNVMKRVAIISSSIVYFHNEITFLNFLGMCIAIVGAFWYTKENYDNNLKEIRQESKTETI